MQDAWRAYLELAMGLTEASRKKAQDAVRRMLGQGGATAAQLQALAEELVSTGLANREALTKLVRFEVDRALGAVGLATADEVVELTRRVSELERELREAKAASAARGTAEPAAATPDTAEATTGAPVSAPPSRPAPAPKKAVAKKAVAKKAVAKKAVAKKPAGTVARTSAGEAPAASGSTGERAGKAAGRKPAEGDAS